jgi:hypothetical protein
MTREMIRCLDAPHEAELAAARLRALVFSARVDNVVETLLAPAC